MSAMSRIYNNDGNYDLDLRNSGNGWVGTFGTILREAVEDITAEGAFGPVEVTFDNGRVLTGTLHGFGSGDNTVRVESLCIELDRIERFRA
ncbi:hypothetical protein SEA_RINGER_85 [Mycobacterium phage Ringer]|uniref:Uncharacterized protein n=1 Tax=Mycobacterium phage Kugel TaxID=2923003 RepID=G8IBC3_9CAUD|nr:hypothetical protein CM00_gp85 [Mycobacterium phage Kugel]YP_009209471.1 hypothetical protein AVT14_gp82 [Mycobacterium phage Abrogate]AXC33640.1 hypothetical protein SEA_MICHLEY_85 [Mycobacterium phage Michley]AZF93981.1 hypothetical protein SEA_RHYNN_82 [Mycobacterium phage Rhynn]QBI99533.1 hypothetical protein SEA_RINGER_85 [Mycobacterium phage Ringer]QBP31379.1 hypothetical protein SEA_DULCIE_86 [Mycobacterium phage Dulcie]QGJ87973.1 hypothetical protein SEA_KILLIGREW_81 [Mycobacterium